MPSCVGLRAFPSTTPGHPEGDHIKEHRILFWLTFLLPRGFRAHYGHDLVRFLQLQRLEPRYKSRLGALWFWVDVLTDLLRGGLMLRIDRGSPPGRTIKCARSREAAMAGMMQDLRYAVISLWRAPARTLVLVGMLTLGIGAATTVLTIVNGVLLNPLPFHESDKLMAVSVAYREATGAGERLVGTQRRTLSFPFYQALRATPLGFGNLGVWGPLSATLNFGGQAERMRGVRVSASLFDALGTRPLQGRLLMPEDDLPGAPAVALISYDLWQERFGGTPGTVGRAFTINREPYTVAGVLPADFAFPTPAVRFWVSMAAASRTANHYYLRAVGRLSGELDYRQAKSRMESTQLIAPIDLQGNEAVLQPQIQPLLDEVVGPARTTLLVFLAAVGAVLLVCALNVANLLLIRAVQREGETVLKSVLGAGRLRLLRQLLVESFIISLIGCGLGSLLSVVLTDLTLSLAPQSIPRASEVGFGTDVFLMSVAISAAVALVVSVPPCLWSTRANLASRLAGSTRGAVGDGRFRPTQKVLVTAQLAMATVLLVGAGLLIKSYGALATEDTGFEPDLALAVYPTLSSTYSSPDAQRQLYGRAVKRLEALPRITSAALVAQLPLGGSVWEEYLEVEGRGSGEPEIITGIVTVSRNYFKSIGQRLLEGRTLNDEDVRSSEPVVFVNKSLADRYLGFSPLDRRVRITGDWLRVIGVVADVRSHGPGQPATPEIYLPYEQMEDGGAMWLVLRGTRRPEELMPMVRAVFADIDNEVPITIWPMRRLLESELARPRFRGAVLGAFGVAAFFLAVSGVYAVTAFALARRRHEIGVRMALGADRHRILWETINGGIRLTWLGLLLGLLGTLPAGWILQSYLYGVGPSDPLVLGSAVALLTGAAIGACLLASRTAVRTDPLRAIREQ